MVDGKKTRTDVINRDPYAAVRLQNMEINGRASQCPTGRCAFLRRCMNFDIVKCAGQCNRMLPRTAKHFRKDKHNGTYRNTCRACEALEKRCKRADRKATHGVKPWTLLYATKLQGQLYYSTESVTCLPPYTLLAIMQLQHSTDPVTQQPFRLPEPEELDVFKSWDNWMESLSPDDKARTPLLIRVVGGKVGRWVSGNVVFVSAPFGNIIEEFGGLSDARTLFRMLAEANIRVMQSQQIDEEEIRVRADLAKWVKQT